MIKYFSNEADWLITKRDAVKTIDEQSKTRDFIWGKSLDSFANKLKDFLNVKYVVLAKSGTQALAVALKCYGIGTGDKVVTTPLTFIATINAIRLVGAEPIFVDVKKDTWNIDENKIEEKIDDTVKAIMSVDIFGNPCNYKKICEIAKKHNIPVIDDMCQAMTSIYDNKKLGSICDVSCTSFYPTKPFGGFGEGGAIFTNNEKVYKLSKSILDHGSDDNDNCIRIGTNGGFDMLHGVFLDTKMKYIGHILQKRNEIANTYKQMKNVIWQKQEPDAISAWARMQGIVTDSKSIEIINQLFETDDLYNKDVCDNTLYKQYRQNTPNSEYITHNSISFPIYTYMNIKELQNAVNDYNSLV
jgi:dTDP-4-amino-4,6-dideoxygalactose transaminase